MRLRGWGWGAGGVRLSRDVSMCGWGCSDCNGCATHHCSKSAVRGSIHPPESLLDRLAPPPPPPAPTTERLAAQVGPRVLAETQVQRLVAHGVGLTDGVAHKAAVAAVGVCSGAGGAGERGGCRNCSLQLEERPLPNAPRPVLQHAERRSAGPPLGNFMALFHICPRATPWLTVVQRRQAHFSRGGASRQRQCRARRQ
jgi:hypothetical protein